MEPTACHHRPPRAGIDAIDDAASALATIALAIDRPTRHETIVVVLDEARRGRAIVVVDGTDQPDAVIDVVECITQRDGCEQIGGIVVCSVRPATGPTGTDHAGADLTGADLTGADLTGADLTGDDIDRWLEMSEIAELAGVELLEWFVVGRSISCPRDLLGEPPRW